MDGTASTPHVRRRSVAWILWSAVGMCVCSTIALVLWFFLPRWCPEHVARWSPWVDPALRAAAHDKEALHYFLDQVIRWGHGASRTLNRVVRTGNDHERYIACVGLVELGQLGNLPVESVSALVEAMHDPLPRVRKQAIDALTYGDAPEFRNELMRMLRNDDELLYDVHVWKALGNLAITSDNEPDFEQIERFIAIALDPKPAVRVQTLLLLGDIDQPAAHRAITTALADPDESVRSTAVDAAGSAHATPAVAPLMALFAAPEDADLRMRVVRSLGEIGDPAALPVIIRACADPDAEVRRRAVIACGAVGDESQGEVLLKLTRDPDGKVATLARQVMVKLRIAGCEEFFIRELSHPDPERRDEAIRALVSLKGHDLVSTLITRLRDGDAGVRISVARGLGGCGDPRAVTPLLTLLDDPACFVRWHAAMALGKYVDPRIADPLISGLLAGLFQPDAAALRQSKSAEQDPARWHNAVLEALAKQELSDEQRRRVPARKPVPPPAENISVQSAADTDRPIQQLEPVD